MGILYKFFAVTMALCAVASCSSPLGDDIDNPVDDNQENVTDKEDCPFLGQWYADEITLEENVGYTFKADGEVVLQSFGRNGLWKGVKREWELTDDGMVQIIVEGRPSSTLNVAVSEDGNTLDIDGRSFNHTRPWELMTDWVSSYTEKGQTPDEEVNGRKMTFESYEDKDTYLYTYYQDGYKRTATGKLEVITDRLYTSGVYFFAFLREDQDALPGFGRFRYDVSTGTVCLEMCEDMDFKEYVGYRRKDQMPLKPRIIQSKSAVNIYELAEYRLDYDTEDWITIKDVRDDYDSLTWHIKGQEGRFLVLGKDNYSPIWTHNYCLPGDYETVLTGYRGGSAVYQDVLKVHVDDDNDFLMYDWDEVKESDNRNTVYHNALDPNYQFSSKPDIHDGVPGVTIRLLPYGSEACLQKLHEYFCALYGNPMELDADGLADKYHELFTYQYPDSTPYAIWTTPKSVVVLMKYDFRATVDDEYETWYQAYAEPMKN